MFPSRRLLQSGPNHSALPIFSASISSPSLWRAIGRPENNAIPKQIQSNKSHLSSNVQKKSLSGCQFLGTFVFLGRQAVVPLTGRLAKCFPFGRPLVFDPLGGATLIPNKQITGCSIRSSLPGTPVFCQVYWHCRGYIFFLPCKKNISQMCHTLGRWFLYLMMTNFSSAQSESPCVSKNKLASCFVSMPSFVGAPPASRKTWRSG